MYISAAVVRHARLGRCLLVTTEAKIRAGPWWRNSGSSRATRTAPATASPCSARPPLRCSARPAGLVDAPFWCCHGRNRFLNRPARLFFFLGSVRPDGPAQLVRSALHSPIFIGYLDQIPALIKRQKATQAGMRKKYDQTPPAVYLDHRRQQKCSSGWWVLPVSGASTQQGTTGVLDQNLDQAYSCVTARHPLPCAKRPGCPSGQ